MVMKRIAVFKHIFTSCYFTLHCFIVYSEPITFFKMSKFSFYEDIYRSVQCKIQSLELDCFSCQGQDHSWKNSLEFKNLACLFAWGKGGKGC